MQLEGDVVALAPPSLGKLSTVFALTIVALGIFASTATYTRYTSASGVLAPLDGLVTVTAPFNGDILTISGIQGQKVVAGETLAVLRNTQAQSSGRDTYTVDQALLKSRKVNAAGLHEARVGEVNHAVNSALARVEGTRKTLGIALESARIATLKSASSAQSLERQRGLISRGYLAPAGILGAEQAHLADLQAAQQAGQNIASLELELSSAEQAVVQARGQLRTVTAQSADALAILNLDESRLNASAEAVVSSALSGTIYAAPAKRGPVAAGSPLFVVAPPGPTYAHLLLSDAAALKAKLGQRVALQVVAQSQSDAKKLFGTLTELSAAPIPVQSEKGLSQAYLAKVLLDDQAKTAMPMGARVDARLQIETKSLVGWLFDPLARGLRQASFTSN